MNVVQLEGVTKRFGAATALKDVSFAVEKGRIVSLLGPSGCGKTTTLRIIAGFEQPDLGSVMISERSMTGLRPYERNVGLVFQDYALFPHMTVKANVGYGLRQRGVERSVATQRVREYLSLVRMTEMADRYPRQLSGGQQQRVALARALATEPEVLLLDEPLGALDAKLRAELQVELKTILRTSGATTIIVTHDQEEAMSLGDEVILMNEGEIAQRGTATEIYDRPRSRFVAEFVGRSNWFAGAGMTSLTPELATVHTDDGLLLRVASAWANKEPLDVCVRPERVRLGPAQAVEEDSDPRCNRFVATVREVVYLGADVHVYADLENGRRLLANVRHGGVAVEPGQRVCLSFLATDCHVIGAPTATAPVEARDTRRVQAA